MSVLENLRNLPKECIQNNLKRFQIKSTGSIEKDTLNLKNFYFENIEILYSHLPICTHRYLEIALNEDSEKVFHREFKYIWKIFEEFGLSDTSISDLTQIQVKFGNNYIKKNNLQNLPKEVLGKILDKAFEKNGFPIGKDFNQVYFKAIDKEIGSALFEFLEKNVDLRKKENYFLNLINGIVEIHGSLDVDQTFKILKKLEVDLSYNQAKKFIVSKIPDTLFGYNDIIIIHNKDFDDYFNGRFVKNKIKKIYPLETYLKN